MTDDKRPSLDGEGNNRNSVGSNYAETIKRSGKSLSRSVIYSTLFLAGLIVASWALAVYVLNSPHGEESGKNIAGITGVQDDMTAAIEKNGQEAIAVIKGLQDETTRAINEKADKTVAATALIIDNKTQETVTAITKLRNDMTAAIEKNGREAITVIKGLQDETTRTIDEKVDNTVAATALIVDNKTQETVTAITKLRNDMTAAIEKNGRETVAAIKEAQNDMVKALAQDAASAGNSAAVGPRQRAAGQRALELGAEALREGQSDKALLYFINGVNHDPSRMELIQSLADAALNSESTDLADRAIGVLELTTLQVAPDDMATVLDRIAELRAKIAPPLAPKLSPDQAAERFQELSDTYAPGSIWKDGARVASGLSEIDIFQQTIAISRADGNDDRYSDIISKSSELAMNLQQIQACLPLYQHIIACVTEMNGIADETFPDTSRFSSLSASVQGVLAQTWGSLHTLPKPMQDDIRAIPGQMAKIDRGLQEKTSKAPYESAVGLIDAAEMDNTGNFTRRIERVTEALTKAAQEGEAITSLQKRIQLFKRIQNARSNLSKIEIERRAAYQKWALECLNGFMTDWNNERSVSDEEAQQFFYRHDIQNIDETLLIPEVSRVLGRVMSCLTGELDAKEGSSIEYRMASGTKKTLGDF